MQLSDKAIQEFKTIYREEFGEDLSDAEAHEAAQRVLHFFEIILRPLPYPPHPGHELCDQEKFDRSA